VFNGISAQIGYIVPQEYEIHHVGPGQEKHTMKQYIAPRKS